MIGNLRGHAQCHLLPHEIIRVIPHIRGLSTLFSLPITGSGSLARFGEKKHLPGIHFPLNHD